MIDEADIPDLCNATKVRKAARHLSRFYDAALAGSGLRATQFSVLSHLKGHGPLTMLQLAKVLVMDRATIGHNLRPLERDGLITMTTNQKDRRVKVVEVTPIGVERLRLARPGWDRAQTEFEAVFGRVAAAEMRMSMERVVASELPFGPDI